MERKLLDMTNQLFISEYNPRMKYCDKSQFVELRKSKFTEVAMAFDFKKEYKEFYMPKNKPEIVIVPKANYIAVRGKGDPNDEGWSISAGNKCVICCCVYSENEL